MLFAGFYAWIGAYRKPYSTWKWVTGDDIKTQVFNIQDSSIWTKNIPKVDEDKNACGVIFDNTGLREFLCQEERYFICQKIY